MAWAATVPNANWMKIIMPAAVPVMRGVAESARAVVVGHTPTMGRVTPRFGGRVVQIDAGMLAGKFFPGGAPAALEMHGDLFTAVYLDRREPLGAIPPRPAS